MLKTTSKLRVLFNDAHANLPESLHIPQGGVSRFAQILCTYFDKNNKDIELVSLLFSSNTKNNDIYIRETKGSRYFYELVYPRNKLGKSYKKKFTKKEYTNFLEPFLGKLDNLFEKVQPQVIFLNGFSLSNWLILETAYRRKIPVFIQHAGIWKKELTISKEYFSSSIGKIFSSYEKDTFIKAKHQIFLNEFSRDVFFSLHNIPKNKKNFLKTSIVPLPIEIKNPKNVELKDKKSYNIGAVARWDGIKNHDALVRLASYARKNNLPLSVSTVTKWNKEIISNFRDKYQEFVRVVSPMDPEKLKDFYLSQDIIIIPSRFDVSPTVFMEAILQGKPVIISDSVGWVSDFKKFGLSNLIISPRDSGRKINEIIADLIKNKKIYIPRFKKFQQKIIKKHNVKEIFGEYYKIIKNISK